MLAGQKEHGLLVVCVAFRASDGLGWPHYLGSLAMPRPASAYQERGQPSVTESYFTTFLRVCSMPNRLQGKSAIKSRVMDGGIRERVEALRREIAEIQKLDLAYLKTPRPDFMARNGHLKREQRLQEIVDELKSMTDWKKS